MEQYIPKSALVAEIERLRSKVDLSTRHGEGLADAYHAVRKVLDTLEVKVVTSIDTDCRNCDTDYDGD